MNTFYYHRFVILEVFFDDVFKLSLYTLALEAISSQIALTIIRVLLLAQNTAALVCAHEQNGLRLFSDIVPHDMPYGIRRQNSKR